jgi:small subunit ribosomal protein S21
MKVINSKDNWEVCLRKFKKKVADSNKLQDLREREFYEKPSVARKIAKSKAVSRWNKHLAGQQLPKKLF